MFESGFVLLILAALNVFQFIFWSYQNQRLVNKIMSRSYFEYELAQKPETKKEFKVQLPDEEEMSMPDQTRIMDELLQRQI